LTLAEALELLVLYAEAEPAKFERAALRWHARYVTEATPSLLRAQIALAALAELRAESEPAKKVLLGLAQK
jgi:hypothetical protein